MTQFPYLGSIIDNSGGTEADIKARIRKAQAAFSVLNKIWRSTTYSTQSKLASSTRTMQKMLKRLGKESAKAGLKINVKKTNEMRIALTNEEPLYIHTMKLLKE